VEHKISSESLVKLLLGVGLDIQPALVACLFSKIPLYFDGDDDNGKLADSIPRLVLSQFKWLEMLTPDCKVVQQLLDLVEVAPLHIKREAIAIIPEVAQDEDHAEVVDKLHAQLDADPLCTNAILDALSNLTLDSLLLVEVADKVMDLLRTAEPSDLPVVVRYLVQSCSGSQELAKRTVHKLRSNLSFFTPASPSASEEDGKAPDEGQHLTLEALRSGLKFRKVLVSCLLEEIRGVENADDHKPFDIWALIMLREIGEPKRQQEVDKIFKKKVSDGLFKQGFIRDSISKNVQALKPYFRQFCAVADSLMKTHDDGLAAFGTEVYQVLFEVFRHVENRQEVLGNLVTHTGGGDGTTVDAALDVLVHLAREHSWTLRPFAVFIKGTLDYLDNLKPHHIRKLFNVLSMISISGDAGRRELDDDVTIYIRKLLSNPTPKYMQHGIIGAVAAIVALSSVPRVDSSLSQSVEAEETQLTAGGGAHIDQATQLLETVKSKCEGSWRAGVFFYDELASALITVRTRSDTRIKASSLDWMNENLTSTLEETYLDDLPEDESGNDDESLKMPEYCAKAFNGMHKTLRVRAELNLDGDNSQLLLNAVKLLDSTEKNEIEAKKERLQKNERLQMMCALLRLVGAMEWATKDSLESVDALAGCPIFLFDDMHIEDFRLLEPHEQTHVALLLFYVSNWIIEVLNVFCLQQDTDMKKKMVQRANDLLMLLAKLDRVVEMFAIQLPDVNASLEPDALGGASASRGRPKGKGKTGEPAKGKGKAKASKGKAKGKGKAKDDDSDSDRVASPSSAKGNGKEEEEEEDEGGGSSKMGGASGGVATVNNTNKTPMQVASSSGFLTQAVSLRSHASCFRQLDLTVHNVLKYTDEASVRGAGASADSGEAGAEALSDETVLALLQDLWSKVDGMVSQRRSFPFNRGAGAGASASRRQMEPLVYFENMRHIWPAIRRLFNSAAQRLGATEETMDIDIEKSPDTRLQEMLLMIMAILERSLDCAEYIGPHKEEHCIVMLSSFSVDPAQAPPSDMAAAAVGAYHFFDPFAQQMPTFKLASSVIFLQAKFADRAGGEVNEAVSEQALWCMTQEDKWGDESVRMRELVTRLLTCHVSKHPRPIECITKIR